MDDRSQSSGVGEAGNDRTQRNGKGVGRVVFGLVLVGVAVVGVHLLRPDLTRSLFGGRTDEQSARQTTQGISDAALEQVRSASLELLKDSRASLEKARGMFESATVLAPSYAAAKAGLAQVELCLAEDLREESEELAWVPLEEAVTRMNATRPMSSAVPAALLCQTLRHVSGYAYLETIPCHLNFSLLITSSNGWMLILLYPAIAVEVNLRGISASDRGLRSSAWR